MSDNDVIKHVVAITKKIDFNGNVNFDRKKKKFFFREFHEIDKKRENKRQCDCVRKGKNVVTS